MALRHHTRKGEIVVINGIRIKFEDKTSIQILDYVGDLQFILPKNSQADTTESHPNDDKWVPTFLKGDSNV